MTATPSAIETLPVPNAPPLGDDDPCPQTLPSSRIPVVEEVAVQETPPKEALFTFAQQVYNEQLRLREALQQAQKGNRRLDRKRKALAARLEVAKAKEAVAIAALAKLRDACLEIGPAYNAKPSERAAYHSALAEARDLITGGRL